LLLSAFESQTEGNEGNKGGKDAEGFDKDYEQGLLRRIPELVRQFRDEHRYT
jgi:hypothetical protein